MGELLRTAWRSAVSARYPLARANEALQRLASKQDGVVRVVVQP